MKKVIIAATALIVACVLGQAEVKIAVVNLKLVFDGYYKTKQSNAILNDRGAEFTKEKNRMDEDYKKTSEEYRKLAESAADPAVSPEEKDKRKKLAEAKLTEVKEIEQSFGAFQKQFATQVQEQSKRMRDKILGEIREVVTSKAKAAGYTLVVDAAAESISGAPIVLFNSGTPDLTEEILTDLNRLAPATDEKKDEKKEGTKDATGSDKK